MKKQIYKLPVLCIGYKEEYKISDAWYNLLFMHRALLDEVIKIDSLIQAVGGLIAK